MISTRRQDIDNLKSILGRINPLLQKAENPGLTANELKNLEKEYKTAQMVYDSLRLASQSQSLENALSPDEKKELEDLKAPFVKIQSILSENNVVIAPPQQQQTENITPPGSPSTPPRVASLSGKLETLRKNIDSFLNGEIEVLSDSYFDEPVKGKLLALTKSISDLKSSAIGNSSAALQTTMGALTNFQSAVTASLSPNSNILQKTKIEQAFVGIKNAVSNYTNTKQQSATRAQTTTTTSTTPTPTASTTRQTTNTTLIPPPISREPTSTNASITTTTTTSEASTQAPPPISRESTSTNASTTTTTPTTATTSTTSQTPNEATTPPPVSTTTTTTPTQTPTTASATQTTTNAAATTNATTSTTPSTPTPPIVARIPTDIEKQHIELTNLLGELSKLKDDIRKNSKKSWGDDNRLVRIIENQFTILTTALRMNSIAKETLKEWDTNFNRSIEGLKKLYKTKKIKDTTPDLLEQFIEKRTKAYEIISDQIRQGLLDTPSSATSYFDPNLEKTIRDLVNAPNGKKANESDEAAFSRHLQNHLLKTYGTIPSDSGAISDMDAGYESSSSAPSKPLLSGELGILKIDATEPGQEAKPAKPFVLTRSEDGVRTGIKTYQIPDHLNPQEIFKETCAKYGIQEGLQTYQDIMQQLGPRGTKSEYNYIMKVILEQRHPEHAEAIMSDVLKAEKNMYSDKGLPDVGLSKYAITAVTAAGGKKPLRINRVSSEAELKTLLLVAMAMGYDRDDIHVKVPNYRLVEVSKDQVTAFKAYAMKHQSELGYVPVVEAEEQLQKHSRPKPG